MVRIIETQQSVTLIDAKEMLRREYDSIQKREKKEEAFKATARNNGQRSTRGSQYSRGQAAAQYKERDGNKKKTGFKGRCYECKEIGHKKASCPRLVSGAKPEFVFSVTSGVMEHKTAWLLDSGASSHMTSDISDFVNYEDLTSPIMITVASGQRLSAKGAGSVRLHLNDGKIVTLTGVLFVPQLDRKLVSISALMARNATVQFQNDRAVLAVKGETVAVIPRVGKLFTWCVSQQVKRDDVQAMTSEEEHPSNSVWHARLGHVSAAKMQLISKASVGVPSMKQLDHDRNLCEGCARGKMSTSPFARQSGSEVKTNQVFDIVHSDLMGPMKPKSKGKRCTCSHLSMISLGLCTCTCSQRNRKFWIALRSSTH